MGTAITSSPRRRGRRARLGLAFLALLLTFLACEGWEDWDTPFRRRYYGWKTSDGGSTVLLPGPDGNLGTNDDQILWVFGDTVVNPGGPLDLILGNTIGCTRKRTPLIRPRARRIRRRTRRRSSRSMVGRETPVPSSTSP